MFLAELAQQSVYGLHGDTVDVRHGFPHQFQALITLEQVILRCIAAHRNDHLAEHGAGALDDVEMTTGDRIERPRAHGPYGLNHPCSLRRHDKSTNSSHRSVASN